MVPGPYSSCRWNAACNSSQDHILTTASMNVPHTVMGAGSKKGENYLLASRSSKSPHGEDQWVDKYLWSHIVSAVVGRGPLEPSTCHRLPSPPGCIQAALQPFTLVHKWICLSSTLILPLAVPLSRTAREHPAATVCRELHRTRSDVFSSESSQSECTFYHNFNRCQDHHTHAI